MLKLKLKNGMLCVGSAWHLTSLIHMRHSCVQCPKVLINAAV